MTGYLDGDVNAIPVKCFERSLHRADAIRPQGPFAGVPFAIKDTARVAGLPNAIGNAGGSFERPGIFGQVGVSDGNPTSVQSSWFLGIGGNSIIPGRIDDRWGIAYFSYDLSDDLLAALAMPPCNLVLGPEEGIEAYYNFAVTPWFRVTGDLQWINAFPGDSEDALFAGIRSQVKF